MHSNAFKCIQMYSNEVVLVESVSGVADDDLLSKCLLFIFTLFVRPLQANARPSLIAPPFAHFSINRIHSLLLYLKNDKRVLKFETGLRGAQI